jgi:quercetin dioxygenase-like cupin family protein
MFRFPYVVAALSLGFGALTQELPVKEQVQSPPGIKRTDLQREDLSTPGREAIQVLVEVPPGTAFPAHSHPGEELVYVTEGSLEYAVAGRPPVTLDAGDTLFIPAGAVHAVRNVGKGNGAELATYIVDKGKPLLVLAE